MTSLQALNLLAEGFNKQFYVAKKYVFQYKACLIYFVLLNFSLNYYEVNTSIINSHSASKFPVSELNVCINKSTQKNIFHHKLYLSSLTPLLEL